MLRDALQAAQTTTDLKKIQETIRALPVPKEALLKYLPINGRMFDDKGQAYISNGAFQWKNGNWAFVKELPSDAAAYSNFLKTVKD